MDATLIRLVVVALLAAAFLAIALVSQRRVRQRTAAVQSAPVPEALLARLPASQSVIVAFSGPHCPSCRQQATALEGLNGVVHILKIDASQEPALASALAVATVPTTVVIDASRRIRAINLGFRPASTLLAQLAGSDGSSTPSGGTPSGTSALAQA